MTNNELRTFNFSGHDPGRSGPDASPREASSQLCAAELIRTARPDVGPTLSPSVSLGRFLVQVGPLFR